MRISASCREGSIAISARTHGSPSPCVGSRAARCVLAVCLILLTTSCGGWQKIVDCKTSTWYRDVSTEVKSLLPPNSTSSIHRAECYDNEGDFLVKVAAPQSVRNAKAVFEANARANGWTETGVGQGLARTFDGVETYLYTYDGKAPNQFDFSIETA